MKSKRSKRIEGAERTRARQTGASVRKLRRKQRAVEAQEKSGLRKCACGCGAEVTRRFKQGHDMRMRPGSQWLMQHPEPVGEARRHV